MKLSDLPNITFAEKDINKILSDMISGFEKAYLEQTGQRKVLRPGDPIRIFLYSQALRELQLRYMIDNAAKQNLLAYAKKDNLQHLGAFSRTDLLEAKPAVVTIKFSLSAAQATDVKIPAGTRVSPGDEIYFKVNEDVTVPAGVMEIDVDVTCTVAGDIGNGFTPGQINILVDPIPWISSVQNTTESQGGIDEEDEDSYRERIHLAPEGFSVAGPTGAYEYFAKKYSSAIKDLRITSSSDGVVDVRVLLDDGELPNQAFLDGLTAYLGDKERRPLTDKLQIGSPTTVTYNLNITYYISSSDASDEASIKTAIEEAVDDYIIWQRSKIGRDVNDSELAARIRLAGAKRVVITSPSYTAIGSNDLAVIGTKTVNYGGLEDE